MMKKINLMLVDDEEIFRKVLSNELSLMGYEVLSLSSGEEACERINRENFDVVLLDIKMPGMGGIEALKAIKDSKPLTEVIMLTGHGTIDNAIKSMKLGAYDYLTKPCSLEELEAIIEKAYEKKYLAQQNIILKQDLERMDKYPEFMGQGFGIKMVLELIRKIADSDLPVLIQGEGGVGKELAARLIYKSSLRKDNVFVVVDCTSSDERRLEEKIFGSERKSSLKGKELKGSLLETAHTGTIFFDEISELSLATQEKLLDLLTKGRFKRVGGKEEITIDVKVISSTKKNLFNITQLGYFREDLFYRLNSLSIFIPPLRERKEDIAILAEYFLDHPTIPGKKGKELSKEVRNLLMEYSWPGNVRELKNVLERAMILSEDKFIYPKDLPPNLRGEESFLPSDSFKNFSPLEEVEREYIEAIVKAFGGKRRKVAEILNISERNLYRKIKKYNIKDF